jgi:hypothetical protein
MLLVVYESFPSSASTEVLATLLFPTNFSRIQSNVRIIIKLRQQFKNNRGYMDRKVEFYEGHLNDMLNRHDSVFSHSDL